MFMLMSMAFAWSGINPKNFKPDHTEVYKKVGNAELSFHVFYPNGKKPKDAPCIVMFHGGGFSKGAPTQFYYLCHYLASRGMVGVSVQYRLNKNNIESVKDGKSAMRYLHKNAAKYGIDSSRIAAGGGSAGGCLAAALSTSKLISEEGEDISIPCQPKALVLFNPV